MPINKSNYRYGTDNITMPLILRWIPIALMVVIFSCSSSKRTVNFWVSESKHQLSEEDKINLPGKYKLYTFDIPRLRETLSSAGNSEDESVYVQFPDPDYNLGPFKIWKSSVVADNLIEKYPSLQTYQGFSTTDILTSIRLELPKAGLQVMVTGANQTWYIAPVNPNQDLYIVYYKQDLKRKNNFWESKVR